MAAIGTLTISAMRGTVQGERKPVEIITRPGVAGTGLLVGAYQAPPYTLETDYYSTLANCLTWMASADLLVGTSVSVTDALGETRSDTAVLGLDYQVIRAKGLGGSNTHIVRATWTMASEY
jgi:hypothetical protein